MAFKILYVTGSRKGAPIQLSRFLAAVKDYGYDIKIAGYNSSCLAFYLDWTLDALKDIFDVEHLSFDNDNLRIYYEQVKYFDPDLIISDLEVHSSYIGQLLNKPVWQVSPELLYFGLNNKVKADLGIFKNYSYHFHRQIVLDDIRKNTVYNSSRKMVYSHFGDIDPQILTSGYEWVRPYAVSGKKSLLCQHQVCATAINNDKKYINYLNKFDDVVLFSSFVEENYPNIILKDIYNLSEYSCNLFNAELAINTGQTDFLADAFINKKFSLIIPDFSQTECIVNAFCSQYLECSKIIFADNDEWENKEIKVSYNKDIKYLHEKIKEEYA